MWQRVRSEWPLLVAVLAAIAGFGLEHTWLSAGRLVTSIITVLLVVIIVAAAMRVSTHAEKLAEKVGDPYGTMILTLAAVLVEVLILVIMIHNEASPTLGRDTVYSAVMLDINGIIGLSALLGGFRHGEQPYNDDSSRSYVVMIMTAMGISMLLPAVIPAHDSMVFSCFDIVAMLVLYSVFLRMQTGPHSYFFSFNYPDKRKKKVKKAQNAIATTSLTQTSSQQSPTPTPSNTGESNTGESNTGEEVHHEAPTSVLWSVVVLVVGVILTGILAEVMSSGMNTSLKGLPVPPMMVAIVVALISASPEILTALRAALANRMQSVINIALGATLSTVVLTIPVIEVIGLYQGQRVNMALDPVQTVMLSLTLIIAAINLNDGETNAIEGMTHFVLFATFVALSILGV
ncbi:Sodium-potassium/proton antiporter ChaA [Halomonadaceae bacterium LMG 33818]|uniref:calcium:proton antiporter n=1 Tax=Cernens ardua TaxID=3402176 RepID=UPI003EDC6767